MEIKGNDFSLLNHILYVICQNVFDIYPEKGDNNNCFKKFIKVCKIVFSSASVFFQVIFCLFVALNHRISEMAFNE